MVLDSDNAHSSKGKSPMNEKVPSYRSPTFAHSKPNKEVNRIELKRAYESMRKNQLKQGRLNR